MGGRGPKQLQHLNGIRVGSRDSGHGEPHLHHRRGMLGACATEQPPEAVAPPLGSRARPWRPDGLSIVDGQPMAHVVLRIGRGIVDADRAIVHPKPDCRFDLLSALAWRHSAAL